MITRYIKDNICETELDYIAHGVNCQNVMGSGVAKALFIKWPKVKESYHLYMDTYIPECPKGGKDFLGFVDAVEVDDTKKVVFNCWTQENFGPADKQYVDYNAVKECFTILTRHYNLSKLAIPKIGCGLAGGNWNIVSALIDEITGDDLEVWVYYI